MSNMRSEPGADEGVLVDLSGRLARDLPILLTTGLIYCYTQIDLARLRLRPFVVQDDPVTLFEASIGKFRLWIVRKASTRPLLPTLRADGLLGCRNTGHQ